MIHDIRITITDNPAYMPANCSGMYYGTAEFVHKERRMAACQEGNNIPFVIAALGLAINGVLAPEDYVAMKVDETINEFLGRCIHE